MEIDVVKASKIVGGVAAFIVAAGVIWTTSSDAFDKAHQDYVTIGSLEEAFNKQDVRDIKKEIRRLEYEQSHGGLSDREQWELSDLYDELEDLQ